MRTDENGQPCPSTLGEYYDLVNAMAPGTKASKFLADKIAQQGRNEEVVAADSQMRFLLYTMMMEKS